MLYVTCHQYDNVTTHNHLYKKKETQKLANVQTQKLKLVLEPKTWFQSAMKSKLLEIRCDLSWLRLSYKIQKKSDIAKNLFKKQIF